MVVFAHWIWSLIPFVLGLAGGYQSIHAKFGADSPRVLTTGTGWLYLLSRGVVPIVVYTIWRQLQEPPHDSLLAAALCGLGSEAVLRSRFYLGEKKSPDGKVEEVAKGIFDLVNWYQTLCLKSSGDKLAGERQEFIEKLLEKEVDFAQLSNRARTNAGAWAIEDEKQKLINLITDLEKKFCEAANGQSGDELQQTNKDFILEFGYAAMRLTGRNSLRTFFKNKIIKNSENDCSI